MYLLNTVISSYEIADAVHVMQEADEHVIINVLKTEQFVGHFTGRLWSRRPFDSKITAKAGETGV